MHSAPEINRYPAAAAVFNFYKRYISPMLGPSCRYHPSCSEYALQALNKYGILKGGAKAAVRVLRCNPLFPGGHDPLK